MSKQFPDPCPKVRGGHAFLKKFRWWYEKCQENDGIIRIIPFQVKGKKDPNDPTPPERWPKKIQIIKPVRNPQEPVIEIQLVHGPLSQRVEISARDMATLKQVILT